MSWDFKQFFYPPSTFGQNSKDNSMKTVKLLHKIAMTIYFQDSILGCNYIAFIKFVHVVLPKTRKTIIDCRLDSFLENCLKTQLLGFG